MTINIIMSEIFGEIIDQYLTQVKIIAPKFLDFEAVVCEMEPIFGFEPKTPSLPWMCSAG